MIARRGMHSALWVIGLVAVVAAAGYAVLQWRQQPVSEYLTETVDRGDIAETVSANGTLDPVVLVSVGTQVSGTAVAVHADFNDSVQADQVLVELDPAAYQARVRQTRAALASAQASVELAQANARRSGELFDKGYIARQDLDQARQTLKSAQAQVEPGEVDAGPLVVGRALDGGGQLGVGLLEAAELLVGEAARLVQGQR